MFGFFKFLWKEFYKYRRVTKAQYRMREIWLEIQKGTKDKKLINEWAKLQFQLNDPYGDQEKYINELNKKRGL